MRRSWVDSLLVADLTALVPLSCWPRKLFCMGTAACILLGAGLELLRKLVGDNRTCLLLEQNSGRQSWVGRGSRAAQLAAWAARQAGLKFASRLRRGFEQQGSPHPP